LRISRFLWILAGVLFLGFAANLAFDVFDVHPLDPGPLALVVLLAVAGIAICFLAVRLWKGERSARAQLTWIGLIAALPTLLRMGRYSILAAVVLLAVLLMWTPASIKYFKLTSPKTSKK
jgi:hypothetical protein